MCMNLRPEIFFALLAIYWGVCIYNYYGKPAASLTSYDGLYTRLSSNFIPPQLNRLNMVEIMWCILAFSLVFLP